MRSWPDAGYQLESKTIAESQKQPDLRELVRVGTVMPTRDSWPQINNLKTYHNDKDTVEPRDLSNSSVTGMSR